MEATLHWGSRERVFCCCGLL